MYGFARKNAIQIVGPQIVRFTTPQDLSDQLWNVNKTFKDYFKIVQKDIKKIIQYKKKQSLIFG